MNTLFPPCIMRFVTPREEHLYLLICECAPNSSDKVYAALHSFLVVCCINKCCHHVKKKHLLHFALPFWRRKKKWQSKKLFFLYKKKRTTSSQTKSHWAHTHTHKHKHKSLRTMKLCLSCKTVCWNALLPWHAHIKKKKMLICLSFALIWGFAYASVCVTAWKRKRKGTTQLYSVLC